jgi:Cupredoxin-like domain
LPGDGGSVTVRGYLPAGKEIAVIARKNVALAIALLGLGLAGVALAGVSSGSGASAGSSEISVAVRDGKLSVSPTSFPAGKITLVVVNKGKMTHGLAIMGTGLSPKRTPAIPVGKTARLTVTLKAGMYHVWDPVRSSMSHATMLKAKSSTTAKSGGGSGGGAIVITSGSGPAATGSAMDPGMEGCDHG